MKLKSAILAILLTALLFAGCTTNVPDGSDKKAPPGWVNFGSVGAGYPPEAGYALSVAQDVIEGLQGLQLVYVSGLEYLLSSAPSGRATNWEFGFYDPLLGQVSQLRIENNQMALRQSPAWRGFGDSFTPISPTLSLNSMAAVNASLAAMGSALPTLTPSHTIRYWLQNVDGINLWRIALIEGRTGPIQLTSIDASTNLAISVPAPVEISFGDALQNLTLYLGSLGHDAELIEALALEMKQGGLHYENGWHLVDNILTPPDLGFGDGKSTVWTFIYHSFQRNRTWPVIVYAGKGPVPGLPINNTFNQGGYMDAKFDPAAIIDSDDAVAAGGGPDPVGPWEYTVARPYKGAPVSWAIAGADSGGGYAIDASTGARLGCSTCPANH